METELIKRAELKKLPIYKTVCFECNMGWFEILYDLGQKIMSYCSENNLPLPKIQQIKEKFGVLRFYFMFQQPVEDKHTTTIRKWVKISENESKKICEECGESGSFFITGGRMHIACENHRQENSLTQEEFSAMQQKATKKQKCGDCEKIGLNRITEGEITKYFCSEHYNQHTLGKKDGDV